MTRARALGAVRRAARWVGLSPLVLAIVAVTVPALAAEGSDVNTLSVHITKSGCPANLTVASGLVTVDIRNDAAPKVDELEILQGDTVVGEFEDLGASGGAFIVSLDSGTYTTYCPGAKRSKGTLVVTGTAAPPLGPKSSSAVDAYRATIDPILASLAGDTNGLAGALAAGDITTAKAAYAFAHAEYARVQPIAVKLRDLDLRIDARKGELPERQWTGFHRIEAALWTAGNTKGTAVVARKLVGDVRQLQSLAPHVPLDPAAIANGAVTVLRAAAADKVTGKEERFSHLDLGDVAANVQGAEDALTALRPLVVATNPALGATVAEHLAAVDLILASHRQAGAYVPSTSLTPADRTALAQAIVAVATDFSQIATAVGDRTA